MSKLWWIVGLLLVAAGSFLGGVYYTAMGGRIPPGVINIVRGSGFDLYDSVSGTVVSRSDTSLTLRLADGGTRDIMVDQSTSVTSPSVPRTLADVVVGANVLVVSPAGGTGGAAEMIQVFSSIQ